MQPRKKFRARPKKSGAKKRQRRLSQEKKLVEAGIDKDTLRHKTDTEIRGLLKKTGK